MWALRGRHKEKGKRRGHVLCFQTRVYSPLPNSQTSFSWQQNIRLFAVAVSLQIFAIHFVPFLLPSPKAGQRLQSVLPRLRGTPARCPSAMRIYFAVLLCRLPSLLPSFSVVCFLNCDICFTIVCSCLLSVLRTVSEEEKEKEEVNAGSSQALSLGPVAASCLCLLPSRVPFASLLHSSPQCTRIVSSNLR